MELEGVVLWAGGREVPTLKASQRGRQFAPEWETRKDPTTGMTVTRFTRSQATDQHPYFTGPAATESGRLVFISERTGNPNLFSLNMATGEILQLTDNRWGTLRQYVSPWGNHVGMGKYTVSVNARRGFVYYVQGREVRRVNVATAEETAIVQIPRGWVTAFTHVSSDDALLCIPLVQEAAFEGSQEAQRCHGLPELATAGSEGFSGVEQRVVSQRLRSVLWVINTDGRSQRVWVEQQSWITHVQFRPDDNRYMLFNNEGIGKTAGKQRIWLCDASNGRVWKFRPEPPDRPHWNCHELWTLPGDEVLYHGKATHPETGTWQSFLGFGDISGTNYHEHFMRGAEEAEHSYGHFGVHRSKNMAYSDGYNDMGLISEVSIGADGCLDFRPLCRHDTKWLNQDDHPHPILTPDGRMLIYSSSTAGTADVYGLKL